jgi:hypothetical protein
VSALETMTEIAPGYVHDPKLARPQPKLTLGDTVFKWYDVAPEDEPVPLAIRALARRNLRDSVNVGELEIAGDVGFVILHRCGESFYFLLVCTWLNENELWETVWAKKGDDDFAFRPWPVEGTHRPTFCVWELGAVSHEREAWSDFLRSSRGQADRDLYLAAAYEGYV